MPGSVPNIMRPPQYSIGDLVEALPDWKNAIMVEIGCYQGESTEAFAASGKFGRIFAVDPWSNEEYDPNDKATMHCDMSIVEAAFDKRMLPHRNVLTKWKMRSAEAAGKYCSMVWSSSEQSCFLDFVYIDGDHRYESVLADIMHWRPLIRPGGIIAGHDYGTHHGPVKAVDEVFGKPDRTFKDYSWLVYL